MDNKVELMVLGFSFNQERTGTYGLVLAEKNGIRRLMVIIGTPEAQSIAFKLQHTEPPRPLTHDTFYKVITDFGITLKESFIHEYKGGVFYSQMRLQYSDKEVVIDSRTSDAIALALRTNSPIFTTEDIMKELGVVINNNAEEMSEEENNTNGKSDSFDLDELNLISFDYAIMSKPELQKTLTEAISNEDYELASMLRDELKRRN